MKNIVTVLFMMCSVLLSAQSLSVSDFYLDEKDLTANTQGTTVMDQNGEKCALIKIINPNKGFTFSVGNLGVVKTVEQLNETWVYVPNGIRRITINHPQLGQLRDYNLPTSIERARTYILKLVSGKVIPVVQEDDGMSYFTMNITPKNAVVSIDGKLNEVDEDGSIMIRLSRGNHSYSVSAAGFETVNRSFVLGAERKDEVVTLRSLKSTLQVSSLTKGTRIFVNDKQKGTDTWTGTLQAGNYIIEGRCDGYRSFTKTVQLKESETQRLVIPALEAVYGKLDVAYKPLNAEVYVDGKFVGKSPNVFNVMSGNHTVKVKANGYAEKQETIVVKEGETKQLSGALTKQESSDHNVHKYVDLGLSVKWATCNVGASKPEEYGSYFAWGETKPKSSNRYDWDSYKWCKGSYYTMTKYCVSSSYGTVDGKKVLAPEDDAAHVNWGGDWRMPTHAEQKELVNNTTSTWTSNYNGTGVAGRILTSKVNGNFIFLPAAGNRLSSSFYNVGSSGYYWSASLSSGSDYSACGLYFGSGNVSSNINVNGRCWGQSVRAVCR